VKRIFEFADLTPSEQRCLAAMQSLGYGRFQAVRVESGEICLEPWPTCQKDIKLGAPQGEPRGDSLHLKREVIEFFEHIRSIGRGEIETIEIRGGNPVFLRVRYEHV